MKNPVIDRLQTLGGGENTLFELIVWSLVTFSYLLFGLAVTAIAYGYLQFSS
jgi:hypothetical protein